VNRKFRSFPCYFNILFTLIIALDYIIRLIPGGKGTGEGDEKPKDILCHIQAFSLTLFDKLMLTFMTVYSIIAYLGTFQIYFYKSHEKLIFIILIIISLIVSLITSLLFYLNGISNRSQFCYVETKNNFKKIVDTSVTGILLIISLFCIIKLLINIYQLKKERQNDNENERTNEEGINFHFIRFIASFFINLATFGYVIILINKVFDMESFIKDLVYILLSLIAEMFFTINKELIKEVIKIITCTRDEEIDGNEDDYNQRNTEISENLNEEVCEDENPE
jgi:hypothetical protein